MGFQSPRFCHHPQLLLRQFVYGGSCYCGRNFIYHMVCQLVVIFPVLNRIISCSIWDWWGFILIWSSSLYCIWLGPDTGYIFPAAFNVSVRLFTALNCGLVHSVQLGWHDCSIIVRGDSSTVLNFGLLR